MCAEPFTEGRASSGMFPEAFGLLLTSCRFAEAP